MDASVEEPVKMDESEPAAVESSTPQETFFEDGNGEQENESGSAPVEEGFDFNKFSPNRGGFR